MGLWAVLWCTHTHVCTHSIKTQSWLPFRTHACTQNKFPSCRTPEVPISLIWNVNVKLKMEPFEECAWPPVLPSVPALNGAEICRPLHHGRRGYTVKAFAWKNARATTLKLLSCITTCVNQPVVESLIVELQVHANSRSGFVFVDRFPDEDKRFRRWREGARRHPSVLRGHIWWAVPLLSSLLHFSLCPYTHLLDALHLLRCDTPALSSHLLLLLPHLALSRLSIHLSTCLPRRPPQHPPRVPDERRAVARDTAAIVYPVARWPVAVEMIENSKVPPPCPPLLHSSINKPGVFFPPFLEG